MDEIFHGAILFSKSVGGNINSQPGDWLCFSYQKPLCVRIDVSGTNASSIEEETI